MKPPPYCSSLQDGGGFLCLGCVWLVQFCVGFRIGCGCARVVWKVGEASPEPVGRGWWQQLRLHRTTQAGECPLCGAERLEDGAPARRARYAPLCIPQICPCLHLYERNIAKMDK